MMARRLLFLLLAVVTAWTLPGSAAEKAPRAERPTYALGERWIRNDGIFELIRIEKDQYVFAADAQKQVRLTRDLIPAAIHRDNSYFELDPPPKLTWPLEVGASGSSYGTWRWEGNSAGAYTKYVWKVEQYEEIRVPAGRFHAFRIRLDLERYIGGPRGRELMTNTIHLWYAPEARQLIRGRATTFKGRWGMQAFEVVASERPASLQIAVRAPENQARVESDAQVVRGIVTGGRGVSRVAVSLNGREVFKSEERTPRPEVALSVPVTLTEGRNVVLVTATDAGGDTRQQAVVVVWERPAPATPARPQSPVASVPSPPAPAATPPPPSAVPTPAPPAPAVTAPSPPSAVVAPPPASAPPAPAKPPHPAPVTPPVAAVPPPAPASAASPSPPLKVELSSPADGLKVAQESIAIAGLATGGKGVARVVVTLNGVEASRLEEKTPSRALAVNVPLRLREGMNTLVVTATGADGTLQQEVRTVEYARPAPLAIDFRYPPDGARVTEESTVVTALVTSSKGVAKVTVTVNGKEVAQQAERTPPRSVAVALPLTLRSGPNAIVVSAAEPDGTLRQEVRTVVYDAPKVAAAPPPPAPAVTNDRWAVVIGIGRYENPQIPRLRYTVSDAEAIYQILVGPAGLRKEHVLLLSDTSERKPTLRNIKWALGTFLGRSAKKDDTVLIFFAGHGAPEVDPRGVERDGLAKYLIPADADPDDLYSTALPMDELHTIFGRIEAERVVAFLDACYSGAAGGRTFSAKRTRASNLDDLFLERLTRSKGRAIITASRPSEVSIELPELGHGIFTYYLLQGLNGAADLNRDGIVSLQELYEYLEQQVSQKSRAVGGNQHPVMKGELEGVLPLAKVRGR